MRESPLHTQLGHLFYALKRSPHSKEHRLLELVSTAIDIRNTVAHAQAIEFCKYERLLRLVNNRRKNFG